MRAPSAAPCRARVAPCQSIPAISSAQTSVSREMLPAPPASRIRHSGRTITAAASRRPIHAVMRVPRSGSPSTAPRIDSRARPPSIGSPGSRLKIARTRFSQALTEKNTAAAPPGTSTCSRPRASPANIRFAAGPERETSTEPSADMSRERYWVCPPHRVRAMWSMEAPKARATSAWAASCTSTETIMNSPMPIASGATVVAGAPSRARAGYISTANSATVIRVAGLIWSGGSGPSRTVGLVIIRLLRSRAGTAQAGRG